MKELKKKIILFLLLVLLAGCGNTNYNDEFKKVAEDYYSVEIKDNIKGLDQVEVTLGSLRNINEYNLKSLKKCEDDSKVILVLDNDGNIIDYKYDLKCK